MSDDQKSAQLRAQRNEIERRGILESAVGNTPEPREVTSEVNEDA